MKYEENQPKNEKQLQKCIQNQIQQKYSVICVPFGLKHCSLFSYVYNCTCTWTIWHFTKIVCYLNIPIENLRHFMHREKKRRNDKNWKKVSNVCLFVCFFSFTPHLQTEMIYYIYLRTKKNSSEKKNKSEKYCLFYTNLTHILPWYINFPVCNRKILIYRWTTCHNAKCNRKTEKCLQ